MFSLDALERAAIEKELSAGIKHAPGNTYCSCLATKHTFVTNCTACGYIVCSKVILASQKVASVLPLHPFPSSANATNAKTNIVHAKIPSPSAKNSNICPFCGSVFFMSSDHPDNHKTAAKTAYEQRDRLLNFDREHAKRTQVRDSQADYYVTNAWSSQEEREQADEDDKKRMNRRQQKSRVKKYTMRFDIAGCKVIEEVDDSDDDGPGVTPCDATMLVCKPIEDPRDEELYHQDEAQDNVDAGHRNVNAPELLSARRDNRTSYLSKVQHAVDL